MYVKFNLDISEIHQLKTFSESRPVYGIESINIDEVRKTIRPNLKALVKGLLTCERLKKMRNKGKFGLNELYGSFAGIKILND